MAPDTLHPEKVLSILVVAIRIIEVSFILVSLFCHILCSRHEKALFRFFERGRRR